MSHWTASSTFADQDSFNSDKLVWYVIFSLLELLKLPSVLSFCPAWTIATAYMLAVYSISLTDCKQFTTQLHDLSARQKIQKTTTTSTKTRPCPNHSSVATLVANQGKNTVYNFHALFQCKSYALDHNISINFSACTPPLHIFVPPHIHALSKFLVPVPKNLVEDHSHMSVPLSGMTFQTVSAIMTLRYH